METDSNANTPRSDASIQPTALLSLDTNGFINATENSTSDSSINNNNKRLLDSSASSEQVLIKRRNKLLEPTIVTQQNYCLSYPNNISRCIDCQTASPNDFAMHLTGCRFQHCRT
ncbi:unnamed protein product, partial [Rotaria magnacalcarata]